LSPFAVSPCWIICIASRNAAFLFPSFHAIVIAPQTCSIPQFQSHVTELCQTQLTILQGFCSDEIWVK
jgi:hypothetical protein